MLQNGRSSKRGFVNISKSSPNIIFLASFSPLTSLPTLSPPPPPLRDDLRELKGSVCTSSLESEEMFSKLSKKHEIPRNSDFRQEISKLRRQPRPKRAIHGRQTSSLFRLQSSDSSQATVPRVPMPYRPSDEETANVRLILPKAVKQSLRPAGRTQNVKRKCTRTQAVCM